MEKGVTTRASKLSTSTEIARCGRMGRYQMATSYFSCIIDGTGTAIDRSSATRAGTDIGCRRLYLHVYRYQEVTHTTDWHLCEASVVLMNPLKILIGSCVHN